MGRPWTWNWSGQARKIYSLKEKEFGLPALSMLRFPLQRGNPKIIRNRTVDQSPRHSRHLWSLVEMGLPRIKKTFLAFIYILIWLFLSHSVLRILHIFDYKSYKGCEIYCIFYPAHPVYPFYPCYNISLESKLNVLKLNFSNTVFNCSGFWYKSIFKNSRWL